jgi:hypothetical protein
MGLPTMLDRPRTTACRPDSFAQQIGTAERGAGHKAGQADGEAACVDDVEPVDILVRVDRGEHRIGVDLVRERQLDQDAVNGRIGVEAKHQFEQYGLLGVGRQAVFEGAHAGGGGLAGLVAHIDLACRIIADQNHGEAGVAAALDQGCDLDRQVGEQAGCDGAAVNAFCLDHAFSRLRPGMGVWGQRP